MKNTESSQEINEALIKKRFSKRAKKIKGKFRPISELIERQPKVLIVKSIHDLTSEHRNFYFFSMKNHSKNPKMRFFLANSLASQSSDLLVSLATEAAKKNNLKLIQYSLFPKRLKTNLLILKELLSFEDYPKSIDLLKEIRKEFRKNLMKIKTLVENK